MMDTVCLFVDVPICGFRPNWSREYQDTFTFPPPATVFGMLLSLVGIDWDKKEDAIGVKLSLAIEGETEKARILRKLRRVPQSNKNADPLTSRRPDYQEILLGLKLWVWIDDGDSKISLVEKIKLALNKESRKRITRYGALSLGESSHLINEIKICTPDNKRGRFLSCSQSGFYSFPVWVHHPRCGKKGSTKLMRFEIVDSELIQPNSNDPKWIRILP